MSGKVLILTVIFSLMIIGSVIGLMVMVWTRCGLSF